MNKLGESSMIKKYSSPYNDTLSPKDNNGIKDTANNKSVRDDVDSVIHHDSSPHNEINSPKR